MSHFTMIKTKVVERDHLITALRDLGYQFEVGDLEVRGFQGNKTNAEVRIETTQRGFDIGFRKAGENYECIADWWGIRDVKRETFLQEVQWRYAYHATRAKLEAQGFSIAQEEENSSGQIHLVLR